MRGSGSFLLLADEEGHCFGTDKTGVGTDVQAIMAAIQFTEQQTGIHHEVPHFGNVGQTCTARIIFPQPGRYDQTNGAYGHQSEQ